MALAGMHKLLYWWQKAAAGDQDNPPTGPIATSSSKKTFPSGIKLLYNPEDSVIEYVHPLLN